MAVCPSIRGLLFCGSHSFFAEKLAVALLFGRVASGQLRLCRIDGYHHFTDVLDPGEAIA